MAKRKADDKKRVNEKIDAFRRKCRLEGLKVTPQRIAIYKALLETTEHPSAEAVLKKIRKVHPHVSLDTVSRTLLTLNEIGEAFILEGSGDPKRFDANMEPHHHVRCVKCKRIFDMFHEPFNDIEVPPKIAKKFIIIRKTVHFDGICNLCNKK